MDKSQWRVRHIVKPGCEQDERFNRVTGIVELEDGYVYCALYMPLSCDYFLKVDPGSGEIVDSLNAPDSMHNLVTDGAYLYSLTCSAFMPVIDPAELEYVEWIYPGFGELASGIAVDDRYIYCGTVDHTVFAYDMLLDKVSAVSAVIPELGDPRDLFLSGGYIYVRGRRSEGLFRFDRGDLGDPARLYFLEEVHDLYFDKGRLYIACGKGTKIEWVGE